MIVLTVEEGEQKYESRVSKWLVQAMRKGLVTAGS
jgi:hypothetical protein